MKPLIATAVAALSLLVCASAHAQSSGGTTPLAPCTPATVAPPDGRPAPCMGHTDPTQGNGSGQDTGGMQTMEVQPTGSYQPRRARQCARRYSAREIRRYQRRIRGKATRAQRRKLKLMRGCKA